MKHKEKLKIARKMGGFSGDSWKERKDAIAKRVEKKNARIKLAIKKKNENKTN